jgi:hypothetical protein
VVIVVDSRFILGDIVITQWCHGPPCAFLVVCLMADSNLDHLLGGLKKLLLDEVAASLSPPLTPVPHGKLHSTGGPNSLPCSIPHLPFQCLHDWARHHWSVLELLAPTTWATSVFSKAAR